MLKYIGKKVLIAIATVFVLATATFFLMKLIPGDPFLNDKIPVAVQDKQRAFYGLDKPVPQQYLTYMNICCMEILVIPSKRQEKQ